MRRVALTLALLLLASPAWGAVAFVQAKTATTGGSPFSLAFDASSGAGNLILAIFRYDGTFTSIADDITNAYTQIGTEDTGLSGQLNRVYWAKNATAGTRTITVTTSGGSFVELYLLEASGQGTTPIDNAMSGLHLAQTAAYAESLSLGSTNDLLVAYGISSAGSVLIDTSGFTVDASVNGGTLQHKSIASSGVTTVTFDHTDFPTARDLYDRLIGIQAFSGGYILTEAGDCLNAENGDRLITEDVSAGIGPCTAGGPPQRTLTGVGT